MKKTTLIFALIIAIVGIDQITKIMARDKLRGTPPRAIVGELFVLEYAENPGAFLSLGAKLSEEIRFAIFVIFVCGFVIWALWYVLKKSLSPLEHFSWALIIGGSIGNLIDRIIYGRVIDFMHIGMGGLRTGIFNIADFAIVIGMSILFIKSFEKKPINSK